MDLSADPHRAQHFCSWVRMNYADFITAETLEKAKGSFNSCFAVYQDECFERCPVDCSVMKVTTEIQSKQWPTTDQVWHSSGDFRELLQAYRKCCAIVSIRQLSPDRLVYTEHPKYEPIEFISYVGGVVSLWVGFTFVGIFDYIRHLIRLLYSFSTGRGKVHADKETDGKSRTWKRFHRQESKCQNRRKKYADRMRDSMMTSSMGEGNQYYYTTLYAWQPTRGVKNQPRRIQWIVDKSCPFPVYEYPFDPKSGLGSPLSST